MFDNRKEKEKISTIERFSNEGYTKVNTNDVYWRKITEREYESIPNVYKSKARLFMTIPGILLIGEILVFGCGFPSVILSIIRHEQNAWFGLFLFFILLLFFGSLTIYSLQDKLDRIVTRNSLVNAGEIAEIRPSRTGKHGDTVAAYHTIAVPCYKKFITIEERPVIYAPSTVLVIKSPTMKYHLIPIPYSAADFGTAAQNLSDEMSDISLDTGYDLSEFSKAGSTDNTVERQPVSDEEYRMIPGRYRRRNPFAKPSIGILWLIITAITIALIILVIHKYKTHDDMFIPLLGGTLLEFSIQWLVTYAAFGEGRPMKGQNAFAVDCIPVKKLPSDGEYFISAVIPEKKLYIERILVSHEIYRDISLNEPVRLYFKDLFSGAVYYSAHTLQ